MVAQPESPTPWIGIEDLPVQFANAFGVVPAPNAIFLILGSVMPFGGDPGGQVYSPVKPIARVAIAPAALPSLIEALNEALRHHDEQSRKTQ
jgi:hypothetical protein